MNGEDVSRYYPILYHMAESGSWPSIQNHGLLSTSALLDLFEIVGEDRHAAESQWRPESICIHHPTYGCAVIRDQKPLPEVKLRNLLDGMSTTEYYELLNGKVFFWTQRERLERLLNASAYRNRAHDVLTVDTEALIRGHEDDVWLTHINSGSAIFGTGRRGAGTFKRISGYPFKEIVELAVDNAVMDISELVIRVEEWRGRNPIRIIWNREH